MKLTLLLGEARNPVTASINPERVDGARPHAYLADGGAPGTLLSIGPEEVLVQEPFDQVAEDLEEAWEGRRRSADFDALLSPLAPLAAFLPLVVPMAVAELQKAMQEKRSKAAGRAPVDDDCGPGPDGGERTPGEACAELLPVTCRNCMRTFAPQHLCPGCGAVLVGQG